MDERERKAGDDSAEPSAGRDIPHGTDEQSEPDGSTGSNDAAAAGREAEPGGQHATRERENTPDANR